MRRTVTGTQAFGMLFLLLGAGAIAVSRHDVLERPPASDPVMLLLGTMALLMGAVLLLLAWLRQSVEN